MGHYRRGNDYYIEGRIVGKVKGRVYSRSSGHKTYRPEGWAIQKEILDELSGQDIVDQVAVRHNGQTYRAWLRDFVQHGVDVNFGYGDQVVLTDEYWHTELPEPRAVQLAMELT